MGYGVPCYGALEIVGLLLLLHWLLGPIGFCSTPRWVCKVISPLLTHKTPIGYSLPFTVADSRGAAAPIYLTNFCINVKSNPRMHQNPPVSGTKFIFFWEGGTVY